MINNDEVKGYMCDERKRDGCEIAYIDLNALIQEDAYIGTTHCFSGCLVPPTYVCILLPQSPARCAVHAIE